MSRAISGAVVMLTVLSFGVSAQGHQHGAQAPGGASAQPADTSQGMMHQHMQQMQERMQSMQERMDTMSERMQQMHEMMQSRGQGGMQGMQMQGQRADAQGMEDMGGQRNRVQAQNCIASGPQGALSALLMGSVGGLALTDEQRSTLEGILAEAQEEAMEALTQEQRQQLELAPAASRAICQQTQQAAGAPAAN